MKQIVGNLISAMQQMPVIDGHEHLPPEEEVLSTPADVFTRLYCHYSITSARSAGMPLTREELKDTRIPLEERWRSFRPFLPAIRDTGYARAAQIAARDLYDMEEINDRTYIELSERLQKATNPGLYKRIFQDKCNIKRILNQGSWNDGPGGYAVSVFREFMYFAEVNGRDMRNLHELWRERHGGEFASALDWLEYWCTTVEEEGYVGLKFSADTPSDCVDDETADSLYRKMRRDKVDDGEAAALGIWLMHKAIDRAPKHGFVVAIHCGLVWEVNVDYRGLHPKNTVPFLLRYPHVTFDLYHAGIPWVREMGVIGNQYPNANLDLCWTHQISPYMTEHFLNEWIDLVPVSKIIGFGADTGSPEKVYGIRQMTFENIARALADRIARGLMTEKRAEEICRAWLYENPRRIYGLEPMS